MKNKYCPLLSTTAGDDFVRCQGEACAWYVPDANPFQEGRCSVQMLGAAAPELVKGVKQI